MARSGREAASGVQLGVRQYDVMLMKSGCKYFVAMTLAASLSVHMGAQQPSLQGSMQQARRMAELGQEFILNFSSGDQGSVYVFYNNPRPFCYTYAIPGAWVNSQAESAWHSKDGRQFVGVLFTLAQDLKGFEGETLVERAGASIGRSYEKTLGPSPAGIKLAPFASALRATWKWTAAPVTQGDQQIAVPTKIIADFSPDGIAVITIAGTPDDDGLARRIIATFKTTKDPECYLPVLDASLKAMTEASPSSETTAPAHTDSTAPAPVYTHPTYRWSISYPADWKIDGADPRLVRISTPAGDGVCALHSGAVRFKTVEEFTDFFQAQSDQSFKGKGTETRSSPKQRITLPNDVVGIDVTTEILSGGMSRRIYTLADGVGYLIDCDTYASNWEKLEPSFARIIRSFTLEKKPR
jgi:hypothetical protein